MENTKTIGLFIIVCVLICVYLRYYYANKIKKPFNEWVPILESEKNSHLYQMYKPHLWNEMLTKEEAIDRFDQGTQTNVRVKMI